MSDLLQQFLTTPSPIFEGADYTLIQACAVERLAQTLKHSEGGENFAMSTVYALLNTLYSHNTKDKGVADGQAILIQENVIAAISKIASVFKSEKITPLVLSMLAQQVRHHSLKLDCVIVASLTDIALTGSESSFNDITQILSNLSKSTSGPDSKHASKELSDAVCCVFYVFIDADKMCYVHLTLNNSLYTLSSCHRSTTACCASPRSSAPAPSSITRT